MQDLLTVELRWGNREAPYPDRLTVHRKGKPGQQEEEPLAHELRCWPNIPQVCLTHLTGTCSELTRDMQLRVHLPCISLQMCHLLEQAVYCFHSRYACCQKIT